jgi:DNA polymerase-3 subunit delta'
LHFNALSAPIIAGLWPHVSTIDAKLAASCASSTGNYNTALHLLHDDTDEFPFEQWFVSNLVRAAFKNRRFCYSGFDSLGEKLPVWEGNAEEISRVLP